MSAAQAGTAVAVVFSLVCGAHPTASRERAMVLDDLWARAGAVVVSQAPCRPRVRTLEEPAVQGIALFQREIATVPLPHNEMLWRNDASSDQL